MVPFISVEFLWNLSFSNRQMAVEESISILNNMVFIWGGKIVNVLFFILAYP